MKPVVPSGLFALIIFSVASLTAQAASPSPSSAQPAALGTWGAPIDTASTRDGATLAALPDGSALAIGGYFANGRRSAGADRYDPITNKWSAVTPMPMPRAQPTATTLRDGSVLLAGGTEGTDSLFGGNTDSAILYLPSGKWVSAGHMSTARGGHAALLLGDGRVLVLGGQSRAAAALGQTQAPLATAEIFDPATRSWTQSFAFPEPIEHFTATLLESGKVLLAGGYISNRGAVADAWLFDPGTALWLKARPMLESRSDAIALRLASGKVLLVGGVHLPANAGPGIFTPATDAELYDPASNSWSRLSTPPPIATNGAADAVLLKDGRALLLIRGPSPTTTSPLATAFYDSGANSWSTGPILISAASAFGIKAVPLSIGKVLVLLSNQSVLFDPGGTSAQGAPAAAAPSQPAENPLNSARTTPYLLVSALFFLFILLVRYVRVRIASRPS